MTERALIEAATRLRITGEGYVIATVVAVTGSAYRRPGARMLVTRERWIAGAVSGGCLEGDIVRRSWWCTEECSALVTYDSTIDEDADADELRYGLGLGCNGMVDVLLERSGRSEVDPMALLAECRTLQERATLVTVFRTEDPAIQVGARIAIRPVGPRSPASAGSLHTGPRSPASAGSLHTGPRSPASAGSLHTGPRSPASAGSLHPWRVEGNGALAAVAGAIPHGVTTAQWLTTAGGRVQVLIEAIVPPPRLFVLGTGHDAVPVVQLARGLGWDVLLYAPYARPATRQWFGRADEIVFGPPDVIARRIAASDRAVAVVMNHNFELDQTCVDMLIESAALYIGVLGPRHRTVGILARRGRALDEEPRIHAPVGLALGGETPSEIALAIVAEVQSVLANAEGVSLRDRPGSIHPAPAGAGHGERVAVMCDSGIV